MKPKHVANMSF